MHSPDLVVYVRLELCMRLLLLECLSLMPSKQYLVTDRLDFALGRCKQTWARMLMSSAMRLHTAK